MLLSQVHRLRALVLLGRFLDMGGWAVDLALSVGIFPYVLKLLQTTAADLRTTLVFIWAKILALDASCQARRPAALPPTPAPRRARRSDWDRLTCAAGPVYIQDLARARGRQGVYICSVHALLRFQAA